MGSGAGSADIVILECEPRGVASMVLGADSGIWARGHFWGGVLIFGFSVLGFWWWVWCLEACKNGCGWSDAELV